MAARQRDEGPFGPLLLQRSYLLRIETDRTQVRERGAHLCPLRDSLRVRHLALPVGRDLFVGQLLLADVVRLRRRQRRLRGDVLAARLTRLHALDLAQDLPLLDLVADARVESNHASRDRRSDDREVILGGRDGADDLNVPHDGRPFDPGRLERPVARSPLGQGQVFAPGFLWHVRHGGFCLRGRMPSPSGNAKHTRRRQRGREPHPGPATRFPGHTAPVARSSSMTACQKSRIASSCARRASPTSRDA